MNSENKMTRGQTIETMIESARCSKPSGCECDWHRAMQELEELRQSRTDLAEVLEVIKPFANFSLTSEDCRRAAAILQKHKGVAL